MRISGSITLTGGTTKEGYDFSQTISFEHAPGCETLDDIPNEVANVIRQALESNIKRNSAEDKEQLVRNTERIKELEAKRKAIQSNIQSTKSKAKKK